MPKELSLEEIKFKAKVINAVAKPLNPEMDEISCRQWLAILPEAKRYINKKLVVCRKRINDLENELEILEAEISSRIRKANVGTATERKAIIESTFRLDPRYAENQTKMNKYLALVDTYLADIDNLTEKSFAVRKIADFERVHYMYEED